MSWTGVFDSNDSIMVKQLDTLIHKHYSLSVQQVIIDINGHLLILIVKIVDITGAIVNAYGSNLGSPKYSMSIFIT